MGKWAGLAAVVMMAASWAQADGLHDQIEKALKENVLEVWFPRILDKENGGFLCDFDWQWKPAGRQPKSIVYQARCTWVASKASMKYPADPRYREAAEHGFKALKGFMWDEQNGGWYFHLDKQGKIDSMQGVKHAYGEGFGIYACAAYFQATKDQEGLEMAKKGFAWMEDHGHDTVNGGYYEYFTREGKKILLDSDNPLHSPKDLIGTRIGYKSMNTHIHLLETLAELYRVWPDPKVKERLLEVLSIVRDRIIAPPGAMHQVFNPDWTPVPDVDSFGHDIETGYLLLEAAEVAGIKDDPKTLATAKSMVDHALDYAWDAGKGGFFETGGTFGPVHEKRKGWWTQAEGMNALLIMSKRFPQDPRDYRKLFEKHWSFVKDQVMDAKNGDWYGTSLDTAGDLKGSKASEWKACYHNGRALFNAVDWLEK
jgi:mannobiose 2-epimerase